MIRIRQLRLLPVKNESDEDKRGRLIKKAASLLRIPAARIRSLDIVRESVDARKKPEVLLIYTVDIACEDESEILKRRGGTDVSAARDVSYEPIFGGSVTKGKGAAVVVGAGPAGLFAAYILAQRGYEPLLIERGRDTDSRSHDVESFWRGGALDTESNVQFGEGGAGAFSDGKLNTGIKDPLGRIGYVQRTLVKFGAPGRILYEQHPHVGTDILKDVVRRLREEICALGGQVRFSCRLTGLDIRDKRLCGIEVNGNESIECDRLILATGHSARDTFRMLKGTGLSMEAKSFAAGYRLMHPQSVINLAQYGERYRDFFGAAPYKLTARAAGRGVYSFCMCPGGYVVNASSEAERLCVNGMSYSGRDGRWANSAIIVATDKEDFLSLIRETGEIPDEDDPLIGMRFQEIIEERTYKRAGGRIPLQTLGGFLRDEREKDVPGDFEPESAIKGGYGFCSVRGILPAAMEAAFEGALPELDRRLRGFANEGAVIAAAESRTSSPVRIKRGEDGCASVFGIFPCGEGAGYAGGIVSAAVDGIRTAERVMSYEG